MIHTRRRQERSMCGLVTLALAFAGFWTDGTAGAGADVPAGFEFFEKNIRPILVEKCRKCHGGGKAKGGLSLDRSRARVLKGGDSGPAAVAGKPGESLLVAAVERRGELKMPPKEKLSRARSIASLAGSSWACPGRDADSAYRPLKSAGRVRSPIGGRFGRSKAGLVPTVKDTVVAADRDRPVHPGRPRGEGADAAGAGRPAHA